MAIAPPYPLSGLAIALAASLSVPSPAFCDRAVELTPPPVSAAPPAPAPRAYAPAACVGGAKVGVVVAVSGAVHVQAPGQPPRSLACDAALNACEEIVTAPGASLALLSGDVLVRVGGAARVALAGAEGAPNLFVQRGALRSTDGRSAGAAPVRLGSRDLAASASGADVEFESKLAGPSRLCAYAGSAAVKAGATSRTLGAGQCLAAQGGGVATFDAAEEPSPGLGADGFCAFEVALDDSLTPGAVAAPPLDPVSGCDSPGVDCDGEGGTPGSGGQR